MIGADGIHSTLRAILHPDDPGIRWNGIQMWRGAVDWPAFDGGDSMVIAGDAVAKLVLYPIGPGSDRKHPPDQLGHLRPRRRTQRTAARAGELVAARPVTTLSAISPNGCICRSSTSAN